MPNEENKNMHIKGAKSCWLLWGRDGMKNVYSLIEMTLIIIITIIMPIFVNFTSNLTALHHIPSFIEIFFQKQTAGYQKVFAFTSISEHKSGKSLIIAAAYLIFVFLTANKLSNQCHVFTCCFYKNWNIVAHISFFTTYMSRNI